MSFEQQMTHSARSYVRRGSLRFVMLILFMCIGTVLFVGVLLSSAMLLGYSTEVVTSPVLQLLSDIRQNVLVFV